MKKCFYISESIEPFAYSTPTVIARKMSDVGKMDQESMWLIGLNSKNKVVLKEMIALGGFQWTTVDSRVIFKRALMVNACAIVLVHNHPSGETNPSTEDIQLTKKISAGCSVLDIKLLDHIIVGPTIEYFSFCERNLPL